ncbi:B3 domain-containing protein REM12-like [Capsella rubella]|uniref:B3 domain-containing protein REM12-like n=1 Tax=Capsella rubella TaxID=81985 RepID=UPI000CD5AB8D|nr:B3 domain-containing protein REM12-like [Capsella rubella]
MVLKLSDLGPGCCENRGLATPSSDNDQGKTGNISRKKHRRLRTEEEHVRKKKMKKTNLETEADSSSDHSCFVALVTASNLQKDALYLPHDLTSSVGLQRNCNKIVVTDDRERSWAMDLSFNKSSDTFYISRGWRSFCDENSKKAGGVFVFKLVGNREVRELSFCSTESINKGIHRDKKDKENCMELKMKKKRMRFRVSTSPSQNRFVTLILTDDNLTKSRRYLPLSFTRENGLDESGIITLVGKDGARWEGSIRREKTGIMCLRRSWKNFAIANGLKSGESFTLEAILENGTRLLRLSSTEATRDRMQKEECSKGSEKESIFSEHSSGKESSKAKNNRDVRRNSFPASLHPFVTLTLTHDNLIKSRRYLPLSFTRENGLDEPGIITLVGNDGTKLEAIIRREKTGMMCLGNGWKEFAISNGLKSGESFTLEAILENGTPMLSLCSTESTSGRSQQGECSKNSEKESISAEIIRGYKNSKATSTREERRDLSSAIQNQSVTLTLTPEDVRDCKLILPSQFMKASGINKLGKITILGQRRMKCFAYLLSKDGVVALGSGWKGFCEANGVKTGDLFTLECVYEQDTTPAFKFSSK